MKAHAKWQTKSFLVRSFALTLSFLLPLLPLSLALTPIHLLHGVAVFVYRIPHKQHSTMNNRMLLKAFKTISKVVLFHTKYLWCSCVFLLSSVYLTVLVFPALHVSRMCVYCIGMASPFQVHIKWRRDRNRERESEWERVKMMKLKRNTLCFIPLCEWRSMTTLAMAFCNTDERSNAM